MTGLHEEVAENPAEGVDDPVLDEAEAGCASTGASVTRVPGAELDDPCVAPIQSFPARLRLAIGPGARAGVNVGAPSRVSANARTSRIPSGVQGAAQ